MNKNLEQAYNSAHKAMSLWGSKLATLEEISQSISDSDQILKLLKGFGPYPDNYTAVVVATDKGVHLFVRGAFTRLFTNASAFIPYSEITNAVSRRHLTRGFEIAISTAAVVETVQCLAEQDCHQFINVVKTRLNLPTDVNTNLTPSHELKVCPDCAEDVKLAANKCRYCGYLFT